MRGAFLSIYVNLFPLLLSRQKLLMPFFEYLICWEGFGKFGKKTLLLIRLFSLLLLFVLLLSYSKIVESTNANREKSILLSFLQRAFSLKSLF